MCQCDFGAQLTCGLNSVLIPAPGIDRLKDRGVTSRNRRTPLEMLATDVDEVRVLAARGAANAESSMAFQAASSFPTMLSIAAYSSGAKWADIVSF